TEVRERDDRRHRAAAVAYLLEELQRPSERFESGADLTGDRELRRDVLKGLARGDPLDDREVLPELDPLDEPCADPALLDHSHLPERCGGGRVVAELLAELDRARERLLRAVGIDLAQDRGERLARRRAQEILSELHARGELTGSIAPRHGEVANLPRQL